MQFEEEVGTIALSPDDGDTRQPQILALAMKSGKGRCLNDVRNIFGILEPLVTVPSILLSRIIVCF